MVWFILTSLLGFLAYYLWRWLYPFITPRRAFVAAVIIGVVIVAVGPWLIFFASAGAIRAATERIADGEVARSLLGFILGVGLGYAKEQQPQSAGLWLSLGGAILLLALSAPHLDGWLSRLTGFKTALIEIQLSSLSSASKSVLRVQRERFVRETNLNSLSSYDQSIELDIIFIKEFELQELKNRIDEAPNSARELTEQKQGLMKQYDQLTRLKGFFENIVSPAAWCFREAIKRGFNVESARQTLVPLADKLTQLIILEREDGRSPTQHQQMESLRDNLLKEVGSAVYNVSYYLDQLGREKCRAINDIQRTQPTPTYNDYDTLPHLDVARAFLLLFVNNDYLGLEVLRGAAQKEFKDFNTPLRLAELMYYEGDNVTQFYELLSGVRSLARSRQNIIKRVNERCVGPCRTEEFQRWISKLTLRAQNVELEATNMIAYAIAVDVAEGHKAAEALLPIAEEYAELLNEANKNPDLQDDAYSDTAAFVTIVAEARRAKEFNTALNKDKVKNAVALLQKVAAHEEARISEELKKGAKVDYSNLQTILAHLSSARGLLD